MATVAPTRRRAAVAALALADLALCVLVIRLRAYTEIDWKAYMQQVETALAGERDYARLRGDTGPLVYPAGFVYLYAAFYRATGGGANLIAAQAIFAGLHVAVVAVVASIYFDTGVPTALAASLLASPRVMSLFVLRLFNDGAETLLAYTAVLLFARRRWNLGCVAYSMAVSIKMNALLYAPAVLLLLTLKFGHAGAWTRIVALCGTPQLVLGAPFLLWDPVSYLTRAFELSRVFMHKWSVNWAMLPPDVFTSPVVAAALLASHVGLLLAFGRRAARARDALSPRHIVATLFTANVIGVATARTIHYQFYAWYFHALPWLLWQTRLPVPVRVGVLAAVELVYNVYPPRAWASALLHGAHATLLVALWRAMAPTRHKRSD